VAEVTRRQFLFPFQNPGIGHAITHSKMIVIDPFTDHCKVITGSHNFSGAASEKNDDNFIVARGNKALAEAYAVACLGTYEHYAWRAYVKRRSEEGLRPWSHLSTQPAWQGRYLSAARKKHLALWCP
jgi:phosphatidylserine/phosphatidylglycerophosphate/cardiolipin synthase-like enzyme